MMKIHLQPPKPAMPLILARPKAWGSLSMTSEMKGKEKTDEYSAECTCEGGSGEEESDSIMLFVSLIPHTQVKDDTGEETTLGDTKEEADSKETREILGDTHEGANDAPCEGQGGEPESWSGEL